MSGRPVRATWGSCPAAGLPWCHMRRSGWKTDTGVDARGRAPCRATGHADSVSFDSGDASGDAPATALPKPAEVCLRPCFCLEASHDRPQPLRHGHDSLDAPSIGSDGRGPLSHRVDGTAGRARNAACGAAENSRFRRCPEAEARRNVNRALTNVRVHRSGRKTRRASTRGAQDDAEPADQDAGCRKSFRR